MRRTPRGVRGLKDLLAICSRERCSSHSARGAWIEGKVSTWWLESLKSHSARGAWIEGLHSSEGLASKIRRTPRGVRGLKVEIHCNINLC